MKIFKPSILALVLGLVMSAATVAQARSGDEQLIASCSTGGEGPGNFVGGITIYQDSNDTQGVLRGRVTDNYMSGYLTCRAERDEVTYVCGGIWGTFGSGTEAMQARLTKTSTPGLYSFDLARRPKFYGGTVLKNVKCRGE